MKNLLFLLVGMLAGGHYAWAQQSAAPDTLPGHARLVRLVSASLCTQLQARPAADIEHLSEPATLELVQQLMTTAMMSDSTALMGMLRQAQQSGRQPRQVGEALGRDAMMQLTRGCPAAAPLVARLGLTKQAQQAVTANQPLLSAADQQALEPLATSLCTQLGAAEANAPFATLTPGQRMTRFSRIFEQQLAAHRARLLRHYSAAQLASASFMHDLGEKTTRLMVTQPACAQFVMQLGVDEIKHRQPGATKP